MKMKPNILICSSSRINSDDLLCAATPEGTIPESADEDSFAPAPETVETDDEDADEKANRLIHCFIETPVANFIEANELTLFDEDEIPENLSMSDYVKQVEAELRSHELPDDAKIDVVWYCTGETAFMDESEKDFIRSAAALPNTLIVASPTIVSNREDFRKEIDALTGLAGQKRIVLAPSASSGLNFISLSSGTWYLVEKTKEMYLDGVAASDKEKKNFEAAWAKFYKEKIDEWQNDLENTLSDCIEQAAGRANFILNRPTDVTLDSLVEEGIDLLCELVNILRGNDEEEDKPGKTDLAHTAELKDNIELMIYEIAACYGRAADKRDVELVLRHSKASRLPKDAAAIAYAVAQVAKAVYEPETEYTSKDLLAIYREAKEDAMEMEFPPFDDDNPLGNPGDDFELNEEDVEDPGHEADDADDVGSTNDVHEPEDELPEDCRVKPEAESAADIKAVLDKYLRPDDPPVMARALEVVFRKQQISVSSLQRELKIGYNKAADIIHRLEQRHVISGPLPGGQKRAVLIHGEPNNSKN